jgi:hypothetical protein
MARRPVIALVLGGADSLFDDMEGALRLVRDPVIVACNNAGFMVERLDHWATLHPEELPWREERRRANGYPDRYVTWTRPYPSGMKDREAGHRTLAGWEGGSSGMFAVGVALEVADRAILCGIPMDTRPHFDRVSGWETAEKYRDAWREKRSAMQKRARSMSGWTAELLGKPQAEWIAKPCTIDTPRLTG